MSTLKVNNIDSYSDNSTRGIRFRSSLIVGGPTESIYYENQVYTGSNEDIYASVALGTNLEATGQSSFAQGTSTKATGFASFAQGGTTTANGGYSHAEGAYTQATGYSSHAEGSSSIASGVASHAEGFNTIADSAYQHVQGKWNESGSGALMVIGNGTSTSNRSNLAEFHASKLVFDVDAFPTSSVGLSTGQLYRTGSSSDEIRIKL